VPMIARWPGHIATKSTTDLLCAAYDILPTVADVVGDDAPQETDGISMLPTLLGPKDQQRRHDFLVWEFYGYGGQQAVRLAQWKGVRQNCHRNPNGPIELYKISTDIAEQHNVASEHPDVIEQIRQIMIRQHRDSGQWQWTPKRT